MTGPSHPSAPPIVMVDDNETDIFIARRCHQIAAIDAPLVTFMSGQEFLDHLEAVAEGREPMPAVVLLDINMPTMDGFEVLRRIRSRAAFERIPVVMMLTNSDRREDVEKARRLGANGFRTKPAAMEEYVAMLKSTATSEAGHPVASK